MSREHLIDLQKECEELVRAGRMGAVAKRLSGINLSNIPRSVCLPLANIARRIGHTSLGLKLLGAIVRPDRASLTQEATGRELAEYGVLLQKAGAIQEALWILNQVDAAEAPEALLYRGFCHLSRWEYDMAAQLFADYTKLEQRAYQRLIGSVNLAASLIALCRWDEAQQVVEETLYLTGAGRHERLKANCLELRAQIRSHQGRYTEARADLGLAADILGAGGSHDQLWTKKWLAVLTSMETRDPAFIRAFRTEAVRNKAWESVRDVDRLALKLEFDQELFLQLLFGTPFEPFRRRLLADHPFPFPCEFIRGSRHGSIFDVRDGRIMGTSSIADLPCKVHMVFAALSRDAYRPLSLGGLFGELFAGEHFDIHSSFNRVHQLLFRARTWLVQNEVPLSIVSEDGRFHLELGPSFGILVPYDHQTIPRGVQDKKLRDLRHAFGHATFSQRHACQRLDLSPTSFKQLMTHAVQSGVVRRIGRGRSTCYSFVDTLSKVS